MRKVLLLLSLFVGSALVVAQNQNYAPSGPTPLGPGDPGWVGQTVQSSPAPSDAGGLTFAQIMKPLSDDWPTYSGDLTGKRHSLLKLVNTTTVNRLSLKWI